MDHDLLGQLSAHPSTIEVAWDYCLENNIILPSGYVTDKYAFFRMSTSGHSSCCKDRTSLYAHISGSDGVYGSITPDNNKVYLYSRSGGGGWESGEYSVSSGHSRISVASRFSFNYY